MIGKMRYVDAANPHDVTNCDVCGEPATFAGGLNPKNAAMRVMSRCDAHKPTRREWDALAAVAKGTS